MDLLLYPQALIMKNSNGFRDYYYSLIRWQDLKSITVESQGSLNLFVSWLDVSLLLLDVNSSNSNIFRFPSFSC